jgi:antitoxin MazE
MLTKIQRWGNSLGLRIPKSLAQETAVQEGSTVDLAAEQGRLVIRPVRSRKYRLGDLLRGIRRAHLHGEVPTGPAVGREVW